MRGFVKFVVWFALFGVAIDVTEQVIRDIGPRLRPESLLMDVTSVKSEPVRAMLACTKANVVGTHPMFGPSVHSLQGQRVVVCPARGDHWAHWVSAMFTARGLAVVEATPEHHDRMMAWLAHNSRSCVPLSRSCPVRAWYWVFINCTASSNRAAGRSV